MSEVPDELAEDAGPEPPRRHGVDINEVKLQEMKSRIAQFISQMEVASPEVLRVTSACQAFEHFAVALRAVERNLYYKSRESQKISTFWSHSWQAGRWKKILTLIIFYNGAIAVSSGLLTGVLMAFLFSFQLLPGFDRGFYGIQWSAWCVVSGCLVTAVVMVLWRSQTQVFLDRICISQDDAILKAKAIFSLAGILKKSDSMLILWDPTWTDRLWCLFELAAFLKSKEQTKKRPLIVRPIFLGPISLAMFITIVAALIPILVVPIHNSFMLVVPLSAMFLSGFLLAMVAANVLRNYFRNLDIMKQQLLSISWDDLKSSCCELNHVNLAGQPMICDRKLLKECVDTWFGSQQVFEDTVRSEVLEILNEDLCERVFSTAWCLGVTSPVLLAFIDLSVTFTFDPRAFLEHTTLAFLLEGLVMWAVALPGQKDVAIQVCRLMRRRPKNQALEFLKNTATVMMMGAPLAVILVSYGLTRWIHFFIQGVHNTHRALAFIACVLLLTAFNLMLGRRLKALLRVPGW